MLVFWILLALLVAALLYGVLIYNGLVSLKHGVAKAWSNIDVLLKQRHDELPKLIETCRQHMQFERETLERVVQARNGADTARRNGDVRAVGEAETVLRAGLGAVIATVEAYPELKSDQSIKALLSRISGLENGIADRREFYNESVNVLNVRIEQFPDVLIARRFAFKPAVLLEFRATELEDVDVRALFSA